MATGSPHLVAAVPQLLRPLRLGLQTYEPHIVGHTLMMLQELLKSHPQVGPALRPFYPRLLPYMGLFRPRKFVVHLPPPFCLAPCGSFSGRGEAPDAGGRSCLVCGSPVDKEYDGANAVQRVRWLRQRHHS